MIINNKLDKSFGKAFSFQGLILILFGLIGITLIWPVIFLIIGILLFFSFSGVEINTEKNELRFYNKLFGIFKTGKWIPLDKYIGLTIVPFKKYSRIFSRSNRSVTMEDKDFRIYLINKHNKPEFPVKKCKSIDDAQDRIDELSLWLKIPVFSIK